MTTLSKRPKAPEQAPPKVGAADTLVIEAGSLSVWQGTNTSAGQIGLKNSRQDVIEVTKKSLGGRRRAVSAIKRKLAQREILVKPSAKHGGAAHIAFDTVARVIELTVESIKQAESQQRPMSESELLREVSTALAAQAEAESVVTDPEEGWEALLLRGLQYKRSVLASDQFKSTGEVAQVFGLGEAAVRRRVRDNKLLALQLQQNDDYRIPVWALGIGADATKALLSAVADPWDLYHVLVAPNGSLNGMRPFELLLPAESLTTQQQVRKTELAQYLGAAVDGPAALAMVLLTLEAESADAPQTA